MKYSMGLDIGIKSIGWAVINDEKNRIEDLGVRIFPAAERPKTKRDYTGKTIPSLLQSATRLATHRHILNVCLRHP